MRLDQDNMAGLIVVSFLIVVISIFMGGIVWENQQTRVMYQTAYQKNMECRIASQKSGFTNSIEKICGTVPKFEDYNK
jgi:amino acid transporter